MDAFNKESEMSGLQEKLDSEEQNDLRQVSITHEPNVNQSIDINRGQPSTGGPREDAFDYLPIPP